MKYALIVSMGLCVASCFAAESSTQQSESGVRSITLINGKHSSYASHIDLSRIDPSSGRSLGFHIAHDLPCVLALLHCHSSTASTGIRRKIRAVSEVHNKVEMYNKKHKRNMMVRDPQYYLVVQEKDALVGRFIGREQYSQEEDRKAAILRLLLTRQNKDAQVEAVWVYLRYKASDAAVRLYEQALAPSEEEIRPSMRWSLLHELARVCFAAGQYQKALDYGLKASTIFPKAPASTLPLGIACRAQIGLQQWDAAIETGKQICLEDSLHTAVCNDLAAAYEHKAWICYLDAVDDEFKEAADDIGEDSAYAAFNLLYYRATHAAAKQIIWSDRATHKFRVSLHTIRMLRQAKERKFFNTYVAKYPGRLAIVLQELHLHDLDGISPIAI
jgi:tetratricopeptide (TPR) repeat protein